MEKKMMKLEIARKPSLQLGPLLNEPTFISIIEGLLAFW